MPLQLRPIEIFPVQQDGKTFIYLRDPQNFAEPLALSPAGYFILAHLDGQHSFAQIKEIASEKFGQPLSGEDLQKFVELLDHHYYMESPRFQNHRKKIVDAFSRLPVRPPAHVGGVYKEDPADLMTQLGEFFLRPNGPGDPDGKKESRTPKAIVAPHIDFHRGGPAYAWAYKDLAESAGADLYILLGTSHCGGEKPFILTAKDFQTPLGIVKTDKEFVTKLQQKCKADLFADEYLHRGEHSLEFQVVFLKYVAERRARQSGRERPFHIVPILVSSFHRMMRDRTLPERSPEVEEFLKALRELVAEDSRQICFVAGVDLAHVGMQFGDRDPVTPEFLKWVEDEDRRLIARLAALDAQGFFNEIAKDQDRRKICGFSPLYSLIHLLDGSRGKELKYSQAFTQETGSAVTFASMVFEEAR